METDGYSLDHYVVDLKKIAAEASDEDEILCRVGPLTTRSPYSKRMIS